MGYLHIENLYKNQDIMIFRECFALEKIHGTSAHIAWRDGQIHFFSGGEKHTNFIKLFDADALKAKFEEMGHETVTIFGEAYGGKCQANSWRYGPELKFVAFDVKVGDYWLDVPNAHQVAEKFGLEFVSYKRIFTDIAELDAARDAFSVQAQRNGIVELQYMEGVVLRPVKEFSDNGGSRIISKHKRPEERETKTNREVVDPAKLAVLEAADDIANEWVTPTRLQHVLDKLGPVELGDMRTVIQAMVEDVVREGKGEIVDSKDARKAIGQMTAKLFKKHFENSLHQEGTK